jgi:hypothetical protein
MPAGRLVKPLAPTLNGLVRCSGGAVFERERSRPAVRPRTRRDNLDRKPRFVVTPAGTGCVAIGPLCQGFARGCPDRGVKPFCEVERSCAGSEDAGSEDPGLRTIGVIPPYGVRRTP